MLRTTFERLPFEIAHDAPIVATLARQSEAVTGTAPALIGQTFWMDSAILSAAGIPSVVFGPGGARAHAVEEWVDLPSVAQCAEVLVATAMAFCA